MMSVYKFVWPTGYSAHMTVPQYEKACQIAERFDMTHTITVQPIFGIQDAIGIDTGTIFIAVLPDGSSHS
jgi:hypothetical protein